MTPKKIDTVITAAVWSGSIISALLAITTRWPEMLKNPAYARVLGAWAIITFLLSTVVVPRISRGVELGIKASAFFLLLAGTFWYITQNGLDYGPGSTAIYFSIPAVALLGIGERYRPKSKTN